MSLLWGFSDYYIWLELISYIQPQSWVHLNIHQVTFFTQVFTSWTSQILPKQAAPQRGSCGVVRLAPTGRVERSRGRGSAVLFWSDQLECDIHLEMYQILSNFTISKFIKLSRYHTKYSNIISYIYNMFDMLRVFLIVSACQWFWAPGVRLPGRFLALWMSRALCRSNWCHQRTGSRQCLEDIHWTRCSHLDKRI